MSNENKQADEHAVIAQNLRDDAAALRHNEKRHVLADNMERAAELLEARATQQATKGERAHSPSDEKMKFLGAVSAYAFAMHDGNRSNEELNRLHSEIVRLYDLTTTRHPIAGSAGQAPIYQNKLKRADSWCDCDKATFDHASKHSQRFDVRVLYAALTVPSLTTDAGAVSDETRERAYRKALAMEGGPDVVGAAVVEPPFANCSFRHCDLPGQCKSEGACHHPARGERNAGAVPQGVIDAVDSMAAMYEVNHMRTHAKELRDWLAAHTATQKSTVNAGAALTHKQSRVIDRAINYLESTVRPVPDGIVSDLRALLAALPSDAEQASRNAAGWISVDDDLPQPETDVLVKKEFGSAIYYDIAGLFDGEWQSQVTEHTVKHRVTHWKPIDAARKAEIERSGGDRV